MGATGLRICDRCHALEKLPPGPPPSCKICGFPGLDKRAARGSILVPPVAQTVPDLEA